MYLNTVLESVKKNTITEIDLRAEQINTGLIEQNPKPKFHSVAAQSTVNILKVLPDGNLLARNNDKKVRIWDTKQLICIKTISEQFKGISYSYGYSVPLANGNLVLFRAFKIDPQKIDSPHVVKIKTFNSRWELLNTVRWESPVNGLVPFITALSHGGFVYSAYYNNGIYPSYSAGGFEHRFFNEQGACVKTIQPEMSLGQACFISINKSLANGNYCFAYYFTQRCQNENIITVGKLIVYDPDGTVLKDISVKGGINPYFSDFHSITGGFIYSEGPSPHRRKIFSYEGNEIKTLGSANCMLLLGEKHYIHVNGVYNSYSICKTSDGSLVKNLTIENNKNLFCVFQNEKFKSATSHRTFLCNKNIVAIIDHETLAYRQIEIGKEDITQILAISDQYLAVCVGNKVTSIWDVDKKLCLQTFNLGGNLALLPEKRLVIAGEHLTICDLTSTRPIQLQDIKILLIALASNQSVAHCNFQGLKLGDEGACVIANLLEKNKYLTALNLSGTGITSKGAKILLEALKTNYNLLQLNLADNDIDEKLMLQIASHLEKNAIRNQENKNSSSSVEIFIEENPPLIERNPDVVFTLANFIPLECVVYCIQRDLAFDQNPNLQMMELRYSHFMDWSQYVFWPEEELNHEKFKTEKNNVVQIQFFLDKLTTLKNGDTLLCPLVFDTDEEGLGSHYSLMVMRKFSENKIRMLYIDPNGDTENFSAFLSKQFTTISKKLNCPWQLVTAVYCEAFQRNNDCGILAWQIAVIATQLTDKEFTIKHLKNNIDKANLKDPNSVTLLRHSMAKSLSNDNEFLKTHNSVIITPNFEQQVRQIELGGSDNILDPCNLLISENNSNDNSFEIFERQNPPSFNPEVIDNHQISQNPPAYNPGWVEDNLIKLGESQFILFANSNNNTNDKLLTNNKQNPSTINDEFKTKLNSKEKFSVRLNNIIKDLNHIILNAEKSGDLWFNAKIYLAACEGLKNKKSYLCNISSELMDNPCNIKSDTGKPKVSYDRVNLLQWLNNSKGKHLTNDFYFEPVNGSYESYLEKNHILQDSIDEDIVDLEEKTLDLIEQFKKSLLSQPFSLCN